MSRWVRRTQPLDAVQVADRFGWSWPVEFGSGIPLSGIRDVPVVVVLGERGYGKTDALQQEREDLVAITAAKLTYVDSERKAHYEGGVSAKSTDFTASSQTMDVYLLPRSQIASQSASQKAGQRMASQSVTGQGRVDRVVAEQPAGHEETPS